MDNSAKNDFDYLKSLSTEKLESLLEIAVNPQSGNEDNEYIDNIIKAILYNEKCDPTGRISNVDEAWNEFQLFYNSTDRTGDSIFGPVEDVTKVDELCENNLDLIVSSKVKSSHKKIKRLLLTAILIILLCGMTMIPILGHENLLQLFAQWTSEQFTFTSNLNSTNNVSDCKTNFESIQDAFEFYQIETHVVPKDIPSDMIASEPQVNVYPSGYIEFSTIYSNDNDYIILQVIQNTHNKGQIYEKNNNNVEILSVDGIDYYLFSNDLDNVAAWQTGTLECSLSTSLELGELKKLVLSI